jgi:hypothetical protein
VLFHFNLRSHLTLHYRRTAPCLALSSGSAVRTTFKVQQRGRSARGACTCCNRQLCAASHPEVAETERACLRLCTT